MHYDFNQEVPRKGTNATKWEFMQDEASPLRIKQTDAFFGENRVLPLWVADMDFPCPQPVVDALVTRAQHGIYGYTYRSDSYNAAVVNWMHKRHGWEIAPEWICTTPGVVAALNLLVRTFVAPGEKVIIQTPVYYPFFSTIENNGGIIADNPLIYEQGTYHMDFEHLEKIAADPHVKMAILCSPHNPVGRVWTTAELTRFGEICRRNNVLVVSDEIHGDLVYSGHTFVPFGSLSQDVAQNAIVCTAPSKTFNMAGMQASNIIIADDTLRGEFEKTLLKNGIFGISAFAAVAVEAAYTYGEDWLDQVLVYIEDNFLYLQKYLSEHIPQIHTTQLEGTYLVWLDCRRLELDKDELQQFFLKDARVYLENGSVFSSDSGGFERINIACPRPILVEALDRIRNAILQRAL